MKAKSALIAFLLFLFYFSFAKPSFAANLSDVVFNEVYYDVDDAHGKETTPVNEWIELYNKTSSPIDISNWQILDNSSSIKTIPASTPTIPVNGVMLISPDVSTWNYWIIDSTVIKLVMGIGNGLSNTGDKLILKDDLGNEIDKLSYSTNIDVWNPAIPRVDEGHSLERNPGGIDNNTIADFVDQETPTPGKFIAEYQSPSPSPTPTLSPTPKPTSTPIPTPTPTTKPSNTPTKTLIPTSKPSLTLTPTLSPTKILPDSVLGEATKSALPTKEEEKSDVKVESLSLKPDNLIAKIFIFLGVVSLLACVIVIAYPFIVRFKREKLSE